MRPGNLLADSAPPPNGERFETLLSHRNLVVERIISSDTPDSRAYIQTQDEWVLLLRGEAVLSIAGELSRMKDGDYVFLPAGTPHSVVSVSDGAVWLGVHLHPDQSVGTD